MKKLVIIGANEYQLPLIEKAKEMKYETHVFAWKEGAVGANTADHFYPISITQIEEILELCKKIKPDGVVTIGSDLANITVAKLTEALKLPGNSVSCIEKSTNKGLMREALKKTGIWTPVFHIVSNVAELNHDTIIYPVIVKPTDRSGSRAITKVETKDKIEEAIQRAIDQSFEKRAIVESYIEGQEYSMELISSNGKHICLATTKKYTTGAPHYIEVGHLQPAPLSEELQEKCIRVIQKALDALGIVSGASHAEFRITKQEEIKIIEIGSRMGGDCIGSHLVPLSTGYDYVKMVIQCALGENIRIERQDESHVSAIRFILNEQDEEQLIKIKKEYPTALRYVKKPERIGEHQVIDSATRYGFYVLQTDTMEEMNLILHNRDFNKEIEIFNTPIQKIYGWEETENQIYMKREDLLPFSFGGNKVRFAKAYIQDMKKNNCDAMIIYGNYHSNLCRILSAVCKREKIPCYMVYNMEDIEETEGGNSQLIKKMDVIPVLCRKETIKDAVELAMKELKEYGKNPYYIYGDVNGKGNEPIAMEAYVEVYQEILMQQKKMNCIFDYIFLATSTNITQAGLIIGKCKNEDGPKIVGISVNRVHKRGVQVLKDYLQIYQEEKNSIFSHEWEKEIFFEDSWLQGGYGFYGVEIEDIIMKMYEENGIAMDPIYTGKAFYGMIEYLKKYKIKGKKILFVHTGGTPLFFDYLIRGKKYE